MNAVGLHLPWRVVVAEFWALTKPRVVSLIVFTAMIGMLMSAPGAVPLGLFCAASLGIALVAGAAAAINCLVEQHIDAKMARTRARPLPRGQLSNTQTLVFAAIIGLCGMALLGLYVNALTMWLTLGTFVGYAIVYTVLLKPATPMNIVIGGASGAMPPILGWAAMTGTVPAEAQVLFLLIFVWTPPHFWALALYRREEYRRAGLPMLPVTHGEYFTRLNVLLYTILLVATTFLPLLMKMSGVIYWGVASVLNVIYLGFAWRLFRQYSDQLARRAFTWSIVYLSLLFAALLVDHYFYKPLTDLLP